jgi:hypothetical protein
VTVLVRLLAVALAALTLAGSAEAARVPDGVSSIRIRSATGITTIVTLPGSVKEIVSAFNALRRFVPRPCPYLRYTPPDVTFDFRSASGAVVLHAVDHAPGTCAGSITLNGQTLAEGNLVARVSSWWNADVDPNARTVANIRLAQRDVPRLLPLAVVPPGSGRTTAIPEASGQLGHCSPGPVTTSPEVSLCRLWKVRMPVGAVFAFERAHRPHGSKITNISTERWRKHRWDPLRLMRSLSFSFPEVRHRVSTRQLAVDIVSLKNGWTGIEVNARDTWVAVRAPDEVVPSGVRTIEIWKRKPHANGWFSGTKFGLVHRVTIRRQVATIVRWFDALPLRPLGWCDGTQSPLFGASVERIAFLDGSRHWVAHALAYPYGRVSSPCFPIAFSVGGHAFAPLLGGRFLIRVEKLLR